MEQLAAPWNFPGSNQDASSVFFRMDYVPGQRNSEHLKGHKSYKVCFPTAVDSL